MTPENGKDSAQRGDGTTGHRSHGQTDCGIAGEGSIYKRMTPTHQTSMLGGPPEPGSDDCDERNIDATSRTGLRRSTLNLQVDLR